MFKLSKAQVAMGAKGAFRKAYTPDAQTSDPRALMEARLQANALARLKIEDAQNHAALADCLAPRSVPPAQFTAAQSVLSNLSVDEDARVFEIVKILKGNPDAG